MDVVVSKVINVNHRGQMILPKKIREQLHMTENSFVKVELMADGDIQMHKVEAFPKRRTLNWNSSENRNIIMDSLEDIKNGKYTEGIPRKTDELLNVS